MGVRRRWLAAVTVGAVGVASLVGGGVLPSVLPAGAQTGGGLVAAYSFDEGSGTVVRDLSGNNNTGSVVNAAFVDAKYGKGLLFNGSSSLVRVPDSASVDLTRSMTLEAWVRPVTVSGWQTIAMKESSRDLSYALYGNSDAEGGLGLYVRGGGVTQQVNRSTSARLAANTWVHVAATYDGTTMRLYRNGSLRVSKTVAVSADVSSGPLTIGGNAVWGEYFNGVIDNVRIYNRALSGAELTTNRDAPVVAAAGVAPAPVTAAPPVAQTAASTTTTTKPVVTITTVPTVTTTVPAVTQPVATSTCPGGTTRMPARAAEPQFVNWPNSANTGVPAGTCLKPSGTITVTQVGAVIDALDVTGCIYVEAENVTIKRTRITTTADCGSGVQSWRPGLKIEDTQIKGTNLRGYCIKWHSYTITRVDLSGCGLGVQTHQNTTVQDSFIHDLYCNAATGDHCDGFILYGESDGTLITNVNLLRNNVHVVDPGQPVTSAILLQAKFGPVSGVTIDGNRLDGGGYTFYGGTEQYGFGDVRNVTFRNNVFGGRSDFGTHIYVGSNVTWSNNRLETTGGLVNP